MIKVYFINRKGKVVTLATWKIIAVMTYSSTTDINTHP